MMTSSPGSQVARMAFVTGMFGTVANNDLTRPVLEAVIGGELFGDGLAQFREAGAGRVLGKPAFKCRDAGCFDVLRSIEVWFTCAETADVDSFGLHCLGL